LTRKVNREPPANSFKDDDDVFCLFLQKQQVVITLFQVVIRLYAGCAIITLLTGAIKGGASSPRIFTIFINALLEHLTGTGQALGVSHVLEETEQFNRVAFIDNITTFSQGNEGAQILLNATQELGACSNMRLNLVKTVVVDIDRGSSERGPQRLTYHDHPVKIFQAYASCRNLGYWATANGDMTATKQRVLEKAEAALAVLGGT
jgi:hypothetical protein